MKIKQIVSKEHRKSQLKNEIEKLFDQITTGEVDRLASGLKNSTTRMIEVITVRKKSALIMDLFEDIEFSHVIFPPSILPLLARHDKFLATLGLRNDKWEIIYLSPPYDTSGHTIKDIVHI